jgi:hypothetical protein
MILSDPSRIDYPPKVFHHPVSKTFWRSVSSWGVSDLSERKHLNKISYKPFEALKHNGFFCGKFWFFMFQGVFWTMYVYESVYWNSSGGQWVNDHAQQPIKLIEGFQFQEPCLGMNSSLVPGIRNWTLKSLCGLFQHETLAKWCPWLR